MIRSLVVLTLVSAVAFAARSFLPRNATLTGSGACLAFGFLLIAAVETGSVLHRLKLPHLTGYLLCGVVFGPEVLGLLTPPMLADLTLIKRVAVGLIALLAGCELNARLIRPRLRSIAFISALFLPITMLALFVFFLGSARYLPFMQGMGTWERVAVALVCANALAALSPAVVIGILSETRAKGPLSTLSMAIVVVADLLIVLVFSVTSTFASSVFPPAGAEQSILGNLLLHVFGSIALGAVLGAVFALYIRRGGARIGLFVFGVLFVLAEAGGVIHLDPLLAGLSAGLFLENISPVSGAEVIRHTESATMPTFAVFFAVIGAEVHLRAFVAVAVFAVGAALIRAGGIWTGGRLGALLAGVEPSVARRVPFGMLPQAGVAIGLANLVKQTWPTWGDGAATMLLGTITLNEMLGPVLFRLSLDRAGEIGKSDAHGPARRPAHSSLASVEPPAE